MALDHGTTSAHVAFLLRGVLAVVLPHLSACWCYQWPVLDPDCSLTVEISSTTTLIRSEDLASPVVDVQVWLEGEEEPTFDETVELEDSGGGVYELPRTLVGTLTRDDPDACAISATVTATLRVEGEEPSTDERFVDLGVCNEFHLALGDFPIVIREPCMSFQCE